MTETGQKLKRLRKANGLTQEQVAKRLNVTPQNVYKYENGIITNIPLDKVELLAKLYHTTPGFISGWETNNRLEVAMKEKRIKASELSEKTGIPIDRVKIYMKDSEAIPKNQVKDICDAIGISKNYLYGIDSEMNDRDMAFAKLPMEYKELCSSLYENARKKRDIIELMKHLNGLSGFHIHSVLTFVKMLKK